MQIKTAMNYHLIPIRLQLSKNQKLTCVGKDVEKLDPLCTTGRNVKWCNCYGTPQKVKTELPYDPAGPLLGICPKELKAGS